MLVFCPRCGAEYPEMAGSYGETANLCRDCGLAVTEEPTSLEPDDDQVAFVLDDWPVEFRGEATAVLVDNGISYRWEAGFALVVPAEVEDRVDALLDEAEAAAEEGLADDEYDDEDDQDEDDEEDEEAPEDEEDEDALEGEVVDADDEGDEDADRVDEDGGEEAQQAMSDLYLVADRLKDQPWDVELRAEITRLATQVSALLPPYGIERPVWNRIGDLAGAVAADIERGAEDDEVVASTLELRGAVREYV